MQKRGVTPQATVWGVIACLVLAFQTPVLAQAEGGGAAEPKKPQKRARPERVKVVGLVAVTKHKSGKIKTATLTKKAEEADAGAKKPDTPKAGDAPSAKDEKGADAAKEEVYSVLLNRRGKKLAEKMDGKTVEVQGYLLKRTDRKTKKESTWLRVGRFKEYDPDAPLEEERKGRGRGRRGKSK